VKQVGHVCYELELPDKSKGLPVFHASKLAKYHLSDDKERHPPPPKPIEVEGKFEYFVDTILDRKKFGKTMKWLVKWQGHARHEATWEPRSALQGNEQFVNYNKLHPL